MKIDFLYFYIYTIFIVEGLANYYCFYFIVLMIEKMFYRTMYRKQQ